MASTSKDTGCLSKIIATVFTTVFAPVLVNFLVQALPPPRDAGAEASPKSGVASDVGWERDLVVCEGHGASPAGARQDALVTALMKVALPLTDPGTPAAKCQAVCEEILRDQNHVVLRCSDSPTQPQPGQGKVFSHRATIELARHPLVVWLWTRGLRSSP